MLGLWQRFRSKSREQPQEQAKLEKRVGELQFIINKIAADLAAILKDREGQSFDIHIDKVCIEEVKLDQIVFNIDGMGVKDLSGSLSIGLNYGGKVIRVETPKQAKPEQPKKDQPKKSSSPLEGQPQIKVNFQSGPKE